MVYAEVSLGFEKIEDLDATLPVDLFRREALPWDAPFRAASVSCRRSSRAAAAATFRMASIDPCQNSGSATLPVTT